MSRYESPNNNIELSHKQRALIGNVNRRLSESLSIQKAQRYEIYPIIKLLSLYAQSLGFKGVVETSQDGTQPPAIAVSREIFVRSVMLDGITISGEVALEPGSQHAKRSVEEYFVSFPDTSDPQQGEITKINLQGFIQPEQLDALTNIVAAARDI